MIFFIFGFYIAEAKSELWELFGGVKAVKEENGGVIARCLRI